MFGFFKSKAKALPKSTTDSWTPPKWYPWDWWQKDMRVEDYHNNSTVEACVATISQTIAMLPVRHIRVNPDGGTEIIKNSAATRVLRKPNPFQTKSEFFVDIVRRMLLTGNGYGVCTRNNRFEIDAIYPQTRMYPFVSYDNRDVYYSMSDETLIKKIDDMIPSRNVLHLRMHTIEHPLIGHTPLEAAVLSAATGNSIQGHTNRFFQNMSRPSGLLHTDLTLSVDQTKALRERFNELSQDLNTGGTPILTSGLKYQPITMSAVDAEIISTYGMTKSDIASVFRVPLALIGDMEKATFANTETLMKYWVSTGLGFIIEHLENSLEELFKLPPNEKLEFDVEFILEASFKERMDGLKVAVSGGIMSPNEARKKEGLPSIKEGDTPLVQMQMVPVDLAARLATSQIDGNTQPPQPTDVVSSDAAKSLGASDGKALSFATK